MDKLTLNETREVVCECKPYLKFTYFDLDGEEKCQYQAARYENGKLVEVLPFEVLPEGEYKEYVVDQDYSQIAALMTARYDSLAQIPEDKKTPLDREFEKFTAAAAAEAQKG